LILQSIIEQTLNLTYTSQFAKRVWFLKTTWKIVLWIKQPKFGSA